MQDYEAGRYEDAFSMYMTLENSLYKVGVFECPIVFISSYRFPIHLDRGPYFVL